MSSQDLTMLLDAPARSDPRTVDQLFMLVYEELRVRAGALLAAERRDHTLDPTALVHEAYLKLVDQSRVDWQGRTHFLAVGAQALRRILIDHGRGQKRAKRGGDWERVNLSGTGVLLGEPQTCGFALAEALEKLEEHDPQQAKVVYLRFFGGLSVNETAEAMRLAVRTVEREWTHAKAWLREELSNGDTLPVDAEG